MLAFTGYGLGHETRNVSEYQGKERTLDFIVKTESSKTPLIFFRFDATGPEDCIVQRK